MLLKRGLVSLSLIALSLPLTADEKKQPLKIVFLMGQSNMVGYSIPQTAWYLTQPMYVPPAEAATARSKCYGGEPTIHAEAKQILKAK